LAKLLEVSELVVHFDTDNGSVEAVDEASISIGEGEIVALVGESGCGKTTMARAILKVIPSPPGRVIRGSIVFKNQNLLVMNEDWLNTYIRGRAITFIPQDPFGSFNPLFTIGTQILDIVGPKYLNNKKTEGSYAPDQKKYLIEIY
jgi:peptide/nickel transport system ATP-binding protein